MDINNITLVYECTEDDGQYRQPLADIVSVGTLICPECGEDMELVDTHTAWENRTVLQILAADLEDQAVQWGDEDGVGDAQRATAKTLRAIDGKDAGGELVHDLLEFLVNRTH